MAEDSYRPYFMKNSPFQILSTPLLCRLQPPRPLLFFLSCLISLMGDHATFDVFFYLMILWIYAYEALVPNYKKDLAMYFTQQSVKSCKVWHIMGFLLVLWFDITHTHTHTHTHTDTHTHTNTHMQRHKANPG